MAAHQAPLSPGFSRQEHWSGLPFQVANSFPIDEQQLSPNLSLLKWHLSRCCCLLILFYNPQSETNKAQSFLALTCSVSSSDSLPYILLCASYTVQGITVVHVSTTLHRIFISPWMLSLSIDCRNLTSYLSLFAPYLLCRETQCFQRKLLSSMSLTEHNLYPLSKYLLHSIRNVCSSISFTQ